MSNGEDDKYAFVCPACEESLEVNSSMKETLVERGCVICGTSVTEEAFANGPVTDSS
jgi:Zn ribbon nucleic-acid-binding protein